MSASDYEVRGGLRVECAPPTEPRLRHLYRVIEYGPERRLTWWILDLLPNPGYAIDPVPILFERCGACGGTPVTAREAEIVLGWPESGWESPENPCFDALRELVHASS